MVTSRFVRRDDAGAVAVITAICSVLLFGVAALTVDIGRLWEVRRSSQSAVDLAALAGALHLPKTPVVACQTALQYLKDNTPPGQNPGDVDSPGQCGAAGTPDGQIEINAKHTRITVRTHPKIVNFGLAGAIGFKNGATAAQATAEIRSPGGIDPFSVSIATPYGLQCLHDTGGGGASAMRASLVQAPPTGQPTITGLSTHVVPIGEQPTVTVNGTNLGGVTQIKLGNVGTVNAVNAKPKAVDFVPPAESLPIAAVDVQAIDPANGTSAVDPASDQLAWDYYKPIVSSVVPNTGFTGDVVTVTGQHFGGNVQVLFGAAPATNINVSATLDSLTATVPAGTGVVDVRVSNPKPLVSDTSNKDKFTYKAPLPPTVTSVVPNSGNSAGGDVVIVNGTNFGSNPTVKFGTATAALQPGGTATSVTVVTPPGTGTLHVTVTNAVATSPTSPADQFTYGTPPTVTGLTPNGGPGSGGTPVAITGTNFTPTSAVFFGGVLATTYAFVDATHMTAVSPGGTGTVDVQVQSGFGLSPIVAADQFTYVSLADSCGSATGDFGYLFVHSNDLNSGGAAANETMMLNIIKGLDHIPDFWPTSDPVPNSTKLATYPIPLDTECLSGSTRLKGSETKLDADTPQYTDGFNCLQVQNGGKVSDAGAAFLDGLTYKNAAGVTTTIDGRLHNPPSGCSKGTVLGRSNTENDSIANFLNGIDMATFIADLNDAVAGNPTNAQLLNPDIVNCPQFTLLPVLHTNIDPPAGQYPLQDYVGAFFEKFMPKGGGSTPQVGAIQAYVFPLDWLGGATPDAGDSIPFVGSGPIIPVLVK